MATFWPTAENLAGLLKGGRRYYPVQDFEPSFSPTNRTTPGAPRTHSGAGLHCLTLGPWLAKLLQELRAATVDHFDFAVDTEVYRPQQEERRPGRGVCFCARPATPRRAYQMAVEALELLKMRLPEVEIILSARVSPGRRPLSPSASAES